MPHFNSYNPSAWGWSPDGSQVVPFRYGGASFPQGVHRLAVPIFTGLINDLVKAGLHVPASGNVMADGNWGYEPRNVRGSSSLSFHAYGLAIDIDAPHNPMSYTFGYGTMPHSAAAIARRWGCEWGGAWSGRMDRMHYEVHLAPDEIAGWVRNLGGSAGQSTSDKPEHPTLREGSTGTAVATVQRRLNLRPATHPAFGPATTGAVKMFQTRHRDTADGVVGPVTWSKLLTAPVLPGERTCRAGNAGPDIGWLQRRLNLSPAVHPAFGPKTETAVKAWQHKVGLTADGVVGSKTWARMGANG